jgi:hypothetical protein
MLHSNVTYEIVGIVVIIFLVTFLALPFWIKRARKYGFAGGLTFGF